MAVDEMYLENLDEYVNDENRVVTYKWLSKTLSVHVNIAKQMLYSFVQRQRNVKDNDNLHVMYCVSGLVPVEDKGSQVYKVKIVPEENLEVEKSTFNSLTSCHIYSIQKSKLQDTDILYSTDYDILKDQIFHSNKFSAIKCLLSKLRSDEELGKLQKIAQPTSQAPSFAKNAAQNGSSTTKPQQQPKKTAGIAGMFAQAGKKAEDKHDKPATEAANGQSATAGKEKQSEKKKPNTGGGIASMFANQANKPKPKPKETKPVSKEKEDIVIVDSPKKTSEKKGPTKRSKAKKTEDSDDEESIQKSKKRRRIKEPVWDSSSSEDDMELDKPIPSPSREPTPPPAEPEPVEVKSEEGEDEELILDSPPPKPGEKRRRRKRKMVSKTTVDSEGFMVTEKVWEEYSTDASEAEEPAQPPAPKQAKVEESGKNKKKEAPAKKQSPGKSKQTSLMNFFKKK